jgi:anti-sigma B factor antagonist
MAEERIRIEADERCIIVHLQMSAVEPADCQELERQVRAELETRARDVVVDCSRIKFLPSLAVGVLVSLRKETSKDGHSFVLAGLTPHIKQVLVLSRLDRLFVVADSLESALAARA